MGLNVNAITTSQPKQATNLLQSNAVQNIKVGQGADSFTPSSTEKSAKNKALIELGVVATIATVAACLLTGKTGVILKGKSIQKKAQKILAQESEIISKGKKELEEVTSLVSQGREKGFEAFTTKDGTKVTFSAPTEDGIRVMDEFLENTKGIQRRTSFNSEDLNVSVILKNTEVPQNGTAKAGECFKYDNGEFQGYSRNVEGSLDICTKDIENADDIIKKADAHFSFEKGRLESYSENINIKSESEASIESLYAFENGKLIAATKARTPKRMEMFGFEEGKNIGYADIETLSDGTQKMYKGYKLVDGKLQKTSNIEDFQ